MNCHFKLLLVNKLSVMILRKLYPLSSRGSTYKTVDI